MRLFPDELKAEKVMRKVKRKAGSSTDDVANKLARYDDKDENTEDEKEEEKAEDEEAADDENNEPAEEELEEVKAPFIRLKYNSV